VPAQPVGFEIVAGAPAPARRSRSAARARRIYEDGLVEIPGTPALVQRRLRGSGGRAARPRLLLRLRLPPARARRHGARAHRDLFDAVWASARGARRRAAFGRPRNVSKLTAGTLPLADYARGALRTRLLPHPSSTPRPEVP
jgi:hypothetical protein